MDYNSKTHLKSQVQSQLQSKANSRSLSRSRDVLISANQSPDITESEGSGKQGDNYSFKNNEDFKITQDRKDKQNDKECCYVRYSSSFELEDQNTFKSKVKRNKWKVIVAGLILLIVIALILVFSLQKSEAPVPPSPPSPPKPPGILNPYRIDEDTIVNQGYKLSANLTVDKTQTAKVSKDYLDYLESFLASSADLKDQELQTDKIFANPRSIPSGINNKFINSVYLEVGQVTSKTTYVTLTDANNTRFSLPEDVVPRPEANKKTNLQDSRFKLLNGSFGFEFTDIENRTIVTTEGQSMILMDKYLQIDMVLPSRRIYGFGERKGTFGLGEGTWTMWAQTPDNKAAEFDDGSGGKQTYGVHPFVLVQTQTKGQFMGIFFRNSNAMSPVITYEGEKEAILSYITIGGQLEMYFMFSGTPKEIIKQYQNIIGKPSLPPLWALGWQAASNAYKNDTIMLQTILFYNQSKIPLEVMCLDNQLTNSKSNFDMSKAFKNLLLIKKYDFDPVGMKLVVTAPVGLRVQIKDQLFYKKAQDDKLLVMSAVNKESELTNFNPQKSVFLDYFNPKTKELLFTGLERFKNQTQFEGTTLSGNVQTTQCDGECEHRPIQSTSTLQDSISSLGWFLSYDAQDKLSTYLLPFIPSTKANLDHKTISLNSTIGTNNYTQYDLHNINGHLYGKINHQHQKETNDKRPFVLSDSTFAGSGKWVGHWIQHNDRTWADMKASIADVMQFSMFGIPMTGAAVGGNYGEENPEIVARWIQLSTFMPLARQSRDELKGGKPNEPYNLPKPYSSWARNAIYDRLKYTRQMYTCLFEASLTGKTCFDPLFYHYPENDDLYKNYESTFIVSDALKVSPVLEAVEDPTFQSYFPNDGNGTWVNMNNYSDFVNVKEDSKGHMVDLKTPLDEKDLINVHLRPGRMVAVQDTHNQTVASTKLLQETGKVELVVNRDVKGYSQGTLFLDGGVSVKELDEKKYEYYQLTMEKNSLYKVNLNKAATVSSGLNMDKLTIVNAANLSSTNFACATSFYNTYLTDLDFTYNETTQTLMFMNKTSDPIHLFDLKSINFGDSSKDINQCKPQTQFYRFQEGHQLKENGAQFLLNVQSQEPEVLAGISIDVRALNGGVVNMNYNFTNTTGMEKVPFAVPETYNAINRSDMNSSAFVFDYLEYSQKESEGMVLNVFEAESGNQASIFELTGFMVSDNYQYFEAYAYYSDKAAKEGVIATFGQRSGDLFVKDGVYGMWTKDEAIKYSFNAAEQNMQSVHPFFMAQISDGSWYGVYSNVAAAQEWELVNESKNNRVKIKVNALGGAGDFYFMFGKDPNEVITKYHNLIGKASKAAQWSLGWHIFLPQNCSTGKCATDLVSDQYYGKAPTDAYWGTPDSFHDFMPFTVNNKHDFNFFIGTYVHYRYTQQFVLPVLSGISYRPTNESYYPLQSGLSQDMLLKDKNGDLVLGMGQTSNVVYPDFFHPNASSWWTEQISNQPISKDAFRMMTNNLCSDESECLRTLNENQNNVDQRLQLQFRPSFFDMQSNSINLNAQHMNGSFSQLDAHSLYGSSMAKLVQEKYSNKRMVIIGSNSFAGYGKFGQIVHDNYPFTEEGLKSTILQSIQYGISGVPTNGAPACGPNAKENPELCARWFMASAFQPMGIVRDVLPLQWKDIYYEDRVTYDDLIFKAMEIKMSWYRYYSTGLVHNHDVGGIHLLKPLFFEFPDDTASYAADQAQNFMIGSSLKVSLGTTPGQNQTDFYFPKGGWCGLYQVDNSSCFHSNGTSKILSTKVYDQNIHLKQGHIVPFQNATLLRQWVDPWDAVDSVNGMQKQMTYYMIYPTCNDTMCYAEGSFINDDGTSAPSNNDTNVYNLTYVQELKNSSGDYFKGNVTFLFNRSASCSAGYSLNIINNNDRIGGITIFNASAMGLNSDNKYNVFLVQEIGGKSGLKNIATAMFYHGQDRLVFKWSGNDAGYVTISSKIIISEKKPPPPKEEDVKGENEETQQNKVDLTNLILT